DGDQDGAVTLGQVQCVHHPAAVDQLVGGVGVELVELGGFCLRLAGFAPDSFFIVVKHRYPASATIEFPQRTFVWFDKLPGEEFEQGGGDEVAGDKGADKNEIGRAYV